MNFDLVLRFIRLCAECVAVVWFMEPNGRRLSCVAYKEVVFWLTTIFSVGVYAWCGCSANGITVIVTVMAYRCLLCRERRHQFEFDVVLGIILGTLSELCYLFGFKFIIFVDEVLREFSLNLPWKVTTTLVVVLEVVALWIICNLKVLRKHDIESISANKYILFFFSACLALIIYMKECLRVATKHSELYEVLWCIVLMIIPVYVAFYIILSRVARSKNMDYNYNIDGVIENGLEVPKCCAMLNIDPCSRTYESEKIAFRKKLNSLNIDHGFKGYSQLILCLVMIRCFENKNTMNLKQDIFKCVSDFTKTNVGALYASFAKIVSSVWLHETTESLQYGYITDDENIKSHIPTVEEFVLHIAETTYC